MDDRLVGKSDNNIVSSASSKRIRSPNSGIQVPSCLVDGCDSDLSKCRDYHRRHKVCELHSKTPRVTIKGQEQRFCQQCSRFHSLVEFDEGKRSCRKRLDGHNRRRRKPQQEPLSTSSARFLENYKGARFLAFDHPQALLTGNSSWTEQLKAKNDHVLYNIPSEINFNDRTISIPECDEEQKQFSFLQGTGSTCPAYSSSQLDDSEDLLSGCTARSQKTFSNTLNRSIQSDCALSLLSSTSAETREFGFTRTLQPNVIPPARSVIPSFSDIGMDGESTNPVLLGGSGNNSDLHFHGMFHVGPDGSSSSGSYQKPFSWE